MLRQKSICLPSFSNKAKLCSIYIDDQSVMHIIPYENLGYKEGFIPLRENEKIIDSKVTKKELGEILLLMFNNMKV